MLIKLEDDKLDRGKELEKLFNLFNRFGNQNGHGITMLINGKYGSGKTTILNFIEEKALKENSSFNVIRLNIWEEKLFDNPLFSLLHKISELESKENINEEAKKNTSKKKWGARFKEVIWQLLQTFTKLDCKTIWQSNENLSQEINLLDEYKAYSQAVNTYKKLLIEYCEKNKIILLIDELDRCLPEYQIKTLEVLHHFFDIPNLIVVIAMDKSQLEHSIKNIFGESLDIIGYLNKFINYEVQLSQGTIEEYINPLLTKIEFPKNYKQDIFKKTMYNILIHLDLSLRDIQQAVSEIALIYNEKLSNNELQVLQDVFYNINGNTFLDPTLIAFLVILKKYRRNIYKKYFIERQIFSKKNQISLLSSTSMFKQFLNELETDIFKNKVENLIVGMDNYYFILNLINLVSPISTFTYASILEYYLPFYEKNHFDFSNAGLEFLFKNLLDHLHRNGNKVRNIIIDRVNLI